MSTVFLLLSSTLAAPPTFEQTKSDVLTSRRNIQSCALTVDRSIREGTAPTRQQTWTLWYDGSRRRGDYTPLAPEATNRLVHCYNCERVGWGIEYYEEKNLLPPFKKLEAFAPKELYLAADPRCFGFVCDQITHVSEKGFESLFGSPLPGSTAVTSSTEDGRETLRLSWQTAGNAKKTLAWTAVVEPTRGNQLTLLAVEGDGFRQALSCELKLWDRTWFPKAITFTQFSGKTLVTTEVAQIRDATFNKPIPGEVFSLAGIGMLPDHPIRVGSETKTQLVKDGKIVPIPEEGKGQSIPLAPPVAVADPGERRVNPWLLAVCAVLALAAGFLIVKKLRARRDAA